MFNVHVQYVRDTFQFINVFFHRTHFDDLAESNDAEGENSNVLNIELIPFEQRQIKQ